MTDTSIHGGSVCHAPRGVNARVAPSLYVRVGKRLFDIVCALALIALTAPVMLAVCALLLLSGSPPLFAHRRVGRNGRAFRCLKFCTMRKDSARMLRYTLRIDPAAAEEWADAQKLAEDPRVTRLGGFLRRTSLDELPQFFNVLRGDMSMVGPRPVTEPELAHYGVRERIYLSARPGLTGPWQVHGRGRTTFEQRVGMDCAYVERVGVLEDICLVLATAAVVLRRSGT